MINTNPKPGFLEALFAATEPKFETFPVQLPGGLKLEFRTLSDYTEIVKLRERANAFIEGFHAVASTEEWRPYAKVHREAISLAYYMAQTVVGDVRLSHLEFVMIAKERANVFETLRDAINAGQYAVREAAEDEAVQEAKND